MITRENRREIYGNAPRPGRKTARSYGIELGMTMEIT
jgi:hypothetical protein